MTTVFVRKGKGNVEVSMKKQFMNLVTPCSTVYRLLSVVQRDLPVFYHDHVRCEHSTVVN